MSNHPEAPPLLPAIDDRLAEPETRFEVIDGVPVYVPPSDPPHATRHAKLAAVLEAHVAEGYTVAVEMLTRTSKVDDIAPDASIYPSAPDPMTGGRQLEEMAFEIASTQSLGNAAKKARRLGGRGVRRVFAIRVAAEALLEWSVALDGWQPIPADTLIADRVFATPVRAHDLAAAGNTNDAVARALLAKENQVLREALDDRESAAKVDALRQSILSVLQARSIPLTQALHAALDDEQDLDVLEACVQGAATCTGLGDLLQTMAQGR